MTSNSTGMYINRMLQASTKLAKDEDSPNTFSHLIKHQVPSGYSTISKVNKSGELTAAATIHVARMKKGSDEWGTEWKHHGSKAIHCYENQILNRNDKGNVTKERDKLTHGLTELTTDKKLVAVQV